MPTKEGVHPMWTYGPAVWLGVSQSRSIGWVTAHIPSGRFSNALWPRPRSTMSNL